LLTPDPEFPSSWTLIERNGTRVPIELDPGALLDYARVSAQAFGVGPNRKVSFSRDLAKVDVGESKKGKQKKEPKS
jgi:CRISPR-associated protein Csb1